MLRDLCTYLAGIFPCIHHAIEQQVALSSVHAAFQSCAIRCLPLCSSFLNYALLASVARDTPSVATDSLLALRSVLFAASVSTPSPQDMRPLRFVQSDPMLRTASAHAYRSLCRASAEVVACSAACSHSRALCVAQPAWSPALALLNNTPAALCPRVQQTLVPTLFSGSCRWRTGVSTYLLASLQSGTARTRDFAAVHGHKIKKSDASPKFLIESSTPVHGHLMIVVYFCSPGDPIYFLRRAAKMHSVIPLPC